MKLILIYTQPFAFVPRKIIEFDKDLKQKKIDVIRLCHFTPSQVRKLDQSRLVLQNGHSLANENAEILVSIFNFLARVLHSKPSKELFSFSTERAVFSRNVKLCNRRYFLRTLYARHAGSSKLVVPVLSHTYLTEESGFSDGRSDK